MLECFGRDPAFDGYALDCYSYPTMLLRMPFTAPAPGLRSIADGLRTFLDEQHSERRDIILVGHSLGGVVTRQLVVSELRANRPLRVRGLALIGVPNSGSMLASVGRLISFPHRQLKRLARDDEGLMGINIDWEQLKVEDQLPVRYVVGGCDKSRTIARFLTRNATTNR
jgi:pimeloyl-ACP methyl ester carboxylesterase